MSNKDDDGESEEESASDSANGDDVDDEGDGSFEFVKEDDGEEPEVAEADEEIEVEEDRYQMDPFLVRREATLILLARKAFNRRTIVFFNEKKQVSRALILFMMFGLKAVEVHGNMTQ